MNNIPLNIDFQQILLHLFNVAILFAILFFLIYKPVKNFTDKRRKEYEDMDEKAARTKEEADSLKAGWEAKLKEAEESIDAMKAKAMEEADLKAAQTKRDAQEQAEAILQKARVQAEKEREKILSDSSEQISELAKEAASRVFFENPSEAYDHFLNAGNQ